MIKLAATSKNTTLADLERECDILSKLSHPNIIKLHTALKTKNNMYLITDYCEEGDLTSFVAKLYKNSSFYDPEARSRVNENHAR